MEAFLKHEKILIKLIKKEHNLYATLKHLKLVDEDDSPLLFSYFEVIWSFLGLPTLNDCPKKFNSDHFTNLYFDLIYDYSDEKMNKTLALWVKEFSKFCTVYSPNKKIIKNYIESDRNLYKALNYLGICEKSPLYGLIADFDIYPILLNISPSEELSKDLTHLIERNGSIDSFFKKWIPNA